jgi:hypothetical protein
MPTTTNRRGRRFGGVRTLVGGLVILLGVVLLADTTGTVEMDGSAVFVAGLLVLYGAYRLVSTGLRRVFWPALFVLVGVLWLAVELTAFTESEAWALWPVVVVLFGLSMLLRRRGSRVVVHAGTAPTGRGLDDDDALAVFGTRRVDLRGVDAPDRIEPVAVFGTVELLVPEGWTVDSRTTAVLGSVEDHRRAPGRASTPDLVVDGVAVFGRVELVD